MTDFDLSRDNQANQGVANRWQLHLQEKRN